MSTMKQLPRICFRASLTFESPTRPGTWPARWTTRAVMLFLLALPSGATRGQEPGAPVGSLGKAGSEFDFNENPAASMDSMTWSSIQSLGDVTPPDWHAFPTDVDVWSKSNVSALPVDTEPSLTEHTISAPLGGDPANANDESVHGTYLVMVILCLLAGGVGCLQLAQ